MVVLQFVSSRRNNAVSVVEQQWRNPNVGHINWNARKTRRCGGRKAFTGTVSKISSSSLTCEVNTRKRVRASNDETEKKKKRKSDKKRKIVKKETVKGPAPEGLDPPPDLPDQLKNRIREMNGTEPKLVIQKKVEFSDLNEHHMRFAMPNRLLKTGEFLTKDEHAIVDRLPTGEAIEVTFIDPELREFKLNFKRWKMGKSFTYNFTSGWLKVLDEIKGKTLMVGDWIQIWCFRREPTTCFALVNLSQVARSCNGCDGEVTSSGGGSGCNGGEGASSITQEEHQMGSC